MINLYENILSGNKKHGATRKELYRVFVIVKYFKCSMKNILKKRGVQRMNNEYKISTVVLTSN